MILMSSSIMNSLRRNGGNWQNSENQENIGSSDTDSEGRERMKNLKKSLEDSGYDEKKEKEESEREQQSGSDQDGQNRWTR